MNSSDHAQSVMGTLRTAPSWSPVRQWIVFALVWMGVFLLGVFNAYDQYRDVATHEDTYLKHQSAIIAQNLGDRFAGADVAMTAMISRIQEIRASGAGTQAIDHYLVRTTDLLQGIRTLVLVDRAGIIIASNRPPLIGVSVRELPRYAEMRAETDPSVPHVLDPFITPTGMYAFGLARVILSPQGEFDGYLNAIVDPAYADTLLRSTTYAPDMRTSLIHKNGVVASIYPANEPLGGENLMQFSGSFFSQHLQSVSTQNAYTGHVAATGEDRILAFTNVTVHDTNTYGAMVAAASRSTDAVFAAWQRTQLITLLIFTVLLIASAGILWIYQRRFLRAENQLEISEISRDQAEAASLAKSEFLSTMSHEIRTPLNVIVGVSSLIDRAAMTPGQLEDISAINVASKNLLALIDNILDFSKIEAGELQLESRVFSYPQLLNDVTAMFYTVARDKALELKIGAIPSALQNGLIGDSNHLKHLLVNLLGNAFKFTQAGGVQIQTAIEALDAADQVVTIKISVVDTGIGMDETTQRDLFKPLTQGDSSTKRVYGGTGLGLSITQRVATLMGGSLTVHSVVGQGSIFTLTLPFGLHHAAADSVAGTPAAISIEQRHVMVVDDSEMNLLVIERQLKSAGAIPTLCNSGTQALTLLKADPTGYDVIVMDLQMPELDGCETTQAIRDQLGLTLPVIALTAGATNTEQARAEAAGMNGFLTKPVDAETLIRTLSATLAAHGA